MHNVFISHSSATAAAAARIEQAFLAAGFDAWLDNSDLGLGVQLRPELNEAIKSSRVMVLVWSAPASRSRWVSAEILTAFHMDRFILPCVTDDTPLPQFFGHPVYLDLRTAGDDALARLVRAAETAPDSANPVPPVVASPSDDLLRACDRLANGQDKVNDALGKRRLAAAARAQQALDAPMADAEARWGFDLTVLNLGGYHRKNAYMVKYWDQIQAGRPPKDPLLLEAERRFFDAALVDPKDLAAINGLASVLVFELELDIATFFNDRALALAAKAGVTYDAAEHDKALIAWMREHGRAG
ncbi:MAG TPA: toll/interleukin-1 receptor domain-containing protein [Vicinamibacterales bacterium]|nr:toll/interleukin-1 receptor domain-containing protein [Vicinamibacterales bacterium]